MYSRVSGFQMRIIESPPPLQSRPLHITSECTTEQWLCSGFDTAAGAMDSSTTVPGGPSGPWPSQLTLNALSTASCSIGNDSDQQMLAGYSMKFPHSGFLLATFQDRPDVVTFLHKATGKLS